MRIKHQGSKYACCTPLVSVCLGLGLSLSLMTGAAQADWQLSPRNSSLTFDSTKNEQVTETHAFTSLSGSVADNGTAKVVIYLASVETQVPVRNERMQSMLFDTPTFPEASVTAELALAPLLALPVGQSLTQEVQLTIDLHGVSHTQAATLLIVRQDAGGVKVKSAAPVMIDVADFALAPGLQALREIAGLKSISPLVPVSFDLNFRQAPM
jgi:polyisoprenoid-binding protein YceI